jgi:hypothetical protein
MTGVLTNWCFDRQYPPCKMDGVFENVHTQLIAASQTAFTFSRFPRKHVLVAHKKLCGDELHKLHKIHKFPSCFGVAVSLIATF